MKLQYNQDIALTLFNTALLELCIRYKDEVLFEKCKYQVQKYLADLAFKQNIALSEALNIADQIAANAEYKHD